MHIFLTPFLAVLSITTVNCLPQAEYWDLSGIDHDSDLALIASTDINFDNPEVDTTFSNKAFSIAQGSRPATAEVWISCPSDRSEAACCYGEEFSVQDGQVGYKHCEKCKFQDPLSRYRLRQTYFFFKFPPWN